MSKDRKIYDPIHGFIKFEPYLLKIIDTPEFQRLRYIKQLGAASYVFPSACHSRFEHSLGVCYLAGEMITSLQKSHPEKDITRRHIELVKIAALIHDIGHGPFSHLWDHHVIFKNEPEHEVRGLNIFKKMIQKYELEITRSEFEIIAELVNPTIESNKKYWYYQIVANKDFAVDVDKLDYIQRDSFYVGNNIGISGNFNRLIKEVKIVETSEGNESLGWNKKLNYELFTVFTTRFKLHKLVYNHHTVKSHEYMLIHLLRDFYEKVKENKINFLDMTDSIVMIPQHLLSIENCPTSEVREDRISIHELICRRKIPKMIGEVQIARDMDCVEKFKYEKFPKYLVNLLIDKVDIRFSGENVNPMEKINYYENKNRFTHEIHCGETKGKEENKNQSLKAIKCDTTWCKTEFNVSIIRCYILGKIDDKTLTEANEVWKLYLQERNII